MDACYHLSEAMPLASSPLNRLLRIVGLHFTHDCLSSAVSPRQGFKRSHFRLWYGRGPLEQFLIHCLGRGVHVIEDGGEPLQPEQVPVISECMALELAPKTSEVQNLTSTFLGQAAPRPWRSVCR